jgi:hypothetical protein
MLPSFFRLLQGVYTIVTLSFLLPEIDQSLNHILNSKKCEHTFNTIRLGQLRTINHQFLGHLLPIFSLRQPHINMRGRQIINMEPHIFFPAIFDELFVCCAG